MNARSYEPNALLAGREGTQSPQHSILTLAALGFLAYYITVMWHEILGHGLVMYLIGAHDFTLTSTSMFSPDVPFDAERITLGGRVALLTGPLSNAALGLALYPLFRSLERIHANITLRYFLWLLTALNFFLGFAYMLFSGVFGVADYAAAIASLPHHEVLRILEVIIGTLLCGATVRFFAVSFAAFPESLWRLALMPYVAASLIFCVAGLRNRNGAYIMMISVIPAALMGQSILLFVTPLARRRRAAAPTPQAIPTSPTAITVALVFAMIVFLTAPGVHFTIP